MPYSSNTRRRSAASTSLFFGRGSRHSSFEFSSTSAPGVSAGFGAANTTEGPRSARNRSLAISAISNAHAAAATQPHLCTLNCRHHGAGWVWANCAKRALSIARGPWEEDSRESRPVLCQSIKSAIARSSSIFRARHVQQAVRCFSTWLTSLGESSPSIAMINSRSERCNSCSLIKLPSSSPLGGSCDPLQGALQRLCHCAQRHTEHIGDLAISQPFRAQEKAPPVLLCQRPNHRKQSPLGFVSDEGILWIQAWIRHRFFYGATERHNSLQIPPRSLQPLEPEIVNHPKQPAAQILA